MEIVVVVLGLIVVFLGSVVVLGLVIGIVALIASLQHIDQLNEKSLFKITGGLVGIISFVVIVSFSVSDEFAYGWEKSTWISGDIYRFEAYNGDKETLAALEQLRITEIEENYEKLTEEDKQSGWALTGEIAGLLSDPQAIALVGLIAWITRDRLIALIKRLRVIAWTASLQHARNGIALVVLLTWNIVLTVVILDLREDQHRNHYHSHYGIYSEDGHSHWGSYSNAGHDHDSRYSEDRHSHWSYSKEGHNHDRKYSEDDHSHDWRYSKDGHTHRRGY